MSFYLAVVDIPYLGYNEIKFQFVKEKMKKETKLRHINSG